MTSCVPFLFTLYCLRSMSIFTHFLITRFNIKNAKPHWQQTKTGSKVLTHEWLKQRFEIFDTYCLPSILNQSNKNFKWLIYFDIDTPEPYKKRVATLVQEHPFIKPIYVDEYQSFLKGISETVLSNSDSSSSHIITTRLDNDDALHFSAIEKIQSLFKNQELAVYNFTKGYCFQTQPFTMLTKYDYPKGPFLSMIEKISSDKKVRTILTSKHGSLNHIQQIEGKRYWLQIIHDQNLSNETLGMPTKETSVLNDFGLGNFEISVSTKDVLRFYLQQIGRKLG